ncbi:MAG TPA: type II secretion system F family protein [Acetobacteraceae bacterium]|jgi:tight adherence protein B|nr:type II secretion system F family protein [Acetobacteraceae bacterium]
MQIAIITVLLLLLLASGVWLIVDMRSKRQIDRQVALALPPSQVNLPLSLRRQQQHSRWQIFHQILGYDPGVIYMISPLYVVLFGCLAGCAIDYLGVQILQLSPPLMAAGAIGAAVFLIRNLFGWQQRQFSGRLFRQLPDVVELVTSTVRAGLPVAEAFRIVAKEMPQPTAGQFDLVLKDLALGCSPEEALDGVNHRTHVAEYGMFAVTLAVQLRSGGSLAETLNTLGETVRQRVGLAGRARALAGEVIFSARALSCAPFVVGGLLYLTNPKMFTLLFTEHLGQLMLAYALSSVIVGTLVIQWMIRRGTAL